MTTVKEILFLFKNLANFAILYFLDSKLFIFAFYPKRFCSGSGVNEVNFFLREMANPHTTLTANNTMLCSTNAWWPMWKCRKCEKKRISPVALYIVYLECDYLHVIGYWHNLYLLITSIFWTATDWIYYLLFCSAQD